MTGLGNEPKYRQSSATSIIHKHASKDILVFLSELQYFNAAQLSNALPDTILQHEFDFVFAVSQPPFPVYIVVPPVYADIFARLPVQILSVKFNNKVLCVR